MYLFICLFLAVLDLDGPARAFSSCGEWELLFVAVCGLLIGVTPLVAEQGSRAHRLGSCGTGA